jgi:hypothetical protein
MNRPFQFEMGIAIHIRTLSPTGGCVVIAVIRQIFELLASNAADSIVVLGNVTVARLSQDRTGFALGSNAFGAGAWGAVRDFQAPLRLHYLLPHLGRPPLEAPVPA